MLVHPITQGVRPSREAAGAQFPPELGAVVAPLLPTHFQIIPMWIDRRGGMMVLAFREALGTDKAAYGLAAQAALARDFPLRSALPEQSHDRLIAGHPALAVLLDPEPRAEKPLGR